MRGSAAIARRPASRWGAVIDRATRAYDQKPASTASAAGTTAKASHGSSALTAAAYDAPAATRSASTAEKAVRAHARPDRDDDEPRPSQRQLGSGAAQRSEDEADQEHHQPAEHVEL